MQEASVIIATEWDRTQCMEQPLHYGYIYVDNCLEFTMGTEIGKGDQF